MRDAEFTHARIEQLVATIRDLTARSGRAWVSWNQVACQQFGSAKCGEVLRNLAKLPECEHRFRMSGDRVALSFEGPVYSHLPPPETFRDTDECAVEEKSTIVGNDLERFNALLSFVQSGGRVCPICSWRAAVM